MKKSVEAAWRADVDGVCAIGMMRFKTGYWKRGAVKAQARTLEDKTVTEYEHEDM